MNVTFTKAQVIRLLGMESSRQEFIEYTRAALRGAFGEYLCREIALQVEKPDNWTDEVISLLRDVRDMMNPEKTKVTFKNRDKALKEAIQEAFSSRVKITYAKNKVSNYYPELTKTIHSLQFDVESEMKAMINEFLPEFSHLIK